VTEEKKISDDVDVLNFVDGGDRTANGAGWHR
jgi:hypothetical protein